MQLGLTVEQSRFIRTFFIDPIIIPLTWFIVKRGVAAGINTIDDRINAKLNKMITDSGDKLRSELEKELKSYLDKKFKEHEDNAFGRLDAIGKRMDDKDK